MSISYCMFFQLLSFQDRPPPPYYRIAFDALISSPGSIQLPKQNLRSVIP